MENKKKSLPKLFSRVTLSMILTSSIVLNSGYAAVATIKSSDSEVQKEDTSVSERRTTTTSVFKADKTEKSASKAGTETSIYDFEYKLSDNDDVIITKYIGSDTVVIIPEDFNGYVVSEIGSSAFKGSKVTSVTLSSTVEKIGASAFRDCQSLTEININNGLKEIDNYAFIYCYALKSVKIPDTCKRIGYEAFYYDTGLETLDLGNGVESIEGDAFDHCQKLTSIRIPDSVTSMGSYAFNDCQAATEISIGKGLKAVPYCAFGSCYGITSITLPDNIEELGNYAFGSCRNLTQINWSANISKIGQYAFEYNYALTSVTIPDTVTVVGTEAFRYCTALEQITIGKNVENMDFVHVVSGDTALKTITVHKDNANFSNDASGALFNKDKTKLIRVGRGYEGSYTVPDTVKTIGTYAFSYCQSLTSVTVGKNVETVEAYAFQYCDKLTTLAFPNTLKTTSGYSFRGCTALETVTLGNSLEIVGSYAFEGCSKLNGVVLPDTCLTIDSYAFHNCYALSSINVGKGLTSINYEAFWSCGALKSITLPESLTKIDTYAFEYSGLQSIVIPDSVTTMGSRVFYCCSALKSVTFGSGMTNVPYAAFNGCTSLASVDIPSTVTSVSEYAFSGCSSLATVTFNEGLASIGSYSFNSCKALTSVTLPESVTTVGGNAFSNCTALESFYVGKSVTSLPVSAFSSDTALKSISVSADNDTFSSVDGVLFNKNVTDIVIFPRAKEGEYVIPDTVEKISDSAFDRANKITAVTIGKSVKSIGNSAFYSCTALTKIVINDDCETVGERAFQGCTALQSVTFGKNTKTLGSYCFYNCYALGEIVFGNSLEAIPYECFENARALTSITIPDSVKSIGTYAFQYCNALESVEFGSGVETISYEAFYGTKLSDVVIPDNVKTVGDYAFTSAPVKSIHIGSGVTSLNPTRTFADSVTTITVSDENTVFTVADNVLYNKDMTILYFCPRLKEGEVIIPGTVTSLGDYAFYNCKKLTSIKEYGNVLSIGSYAINNLNTSGFTAYVIQDSYLHTSFSGKGYTCEVIEDTRTQIGDCTITYDRYVPYAYNARANLKIYENGKELEENKDYKAYYSNNYYHIGDATITIYGMGEYGGKKTVTFTIYENISGSFEARRTGAGTYTFKTTAERGVPDYTYSFEYTEKANANSENAVWREIPTSENPANFSYFFEEDGEFTVRATVTDAIGNKLVKTQNVEVTAPRATMTFSNKYPKVGEKITITGAGTNFGKNKQYKFEYKEAKEEEWTTISDFSSEREIEFTFTIPGSYQLRLSIKDDAENTAEKMQSFNITSPAVNFYTSKTPVLNEKFEICASVSNMVNDCSYMYQYRKSGTNDWTTIKNFTSLDKCPLTLTATGNYQIRVTARYNKDTSIKATNIKTITIKKPATTITAPETANLNDVKTLKVSSSGFGTGLTYKYQYKSVSDTQWRNLYVGTNTSADMEFSQTGNYTVRVVTTDNAGNKAIASQTVSVMGAAVKLEADNDKVYVGEDINLTASFRNIDPSNYTYKFEYRECLSSTWHVFQDYGESNTATFTTRQCATSDAYAAYAGMYEIRVTAKDAGGVTSTANINVIAKKMEFDYWLSQTNVVPDTEVTLNANVTGGAKPVKFMYQFKKDNGDWQPLVYSGYTDKTILKFKFSAEGYYSIRASARDNNGLTIGNTSDATGVGYETKILTLRVQNPVVHTLEGGIRNDTSGRIAIGQQCAFSAYSNYASGTAKYKFTVKSSFDNTEKVLKNFSTDDKVNFSADKEGTYTITAYITDDTGKTVTASSSVVVMDFALSFNVSRGSTTAGIAFSVNTAVAYDSGDSYTYKYEYRLKGQTEWKKFCDFSENAYQTCKLYTEGVYDIRVTARNSSGVEKSSTSSITINPKVNCTISAMPDHVTVDTDTILICSSTGGTGNIGYRYEYCLTGAGQWTEFYNGGSVALFSADTAGVYKVRVTAYDSVGSTKRTEYIKIYVK